MIECEFEPVQTAKHSNAEIIAKSRQGISFVGKHALMLLGVGCVAFFSGTNGKKELADENIDNEEDIEEE